MTASVIISIVALIVTSTTAIAVTVLVSQALSNAFRALSDMHERAGKQQSQLLDRFQAIRWEDLAALRSVDETDEGGFFPPTEDAEPGEVTQELPGRWGSLSALRERLSKEEQALLDEDFDEVGDPR